MPTLTAPSPTSAAAAPISRCARRSTPPPKPERGHAMTALPEVNRRAFLANAVPEINAWVVIRPDDTVVIRIARSEMGQGTLTGLAQLVAEELECDWSK